MKRLILPAVALAIFAGVASSSARANDYGHANVHDQLNHNAYHRTLQHEQAHRYPMTGWQHHQLHDNLNHQAAHDRVDHRSYHYGSSTGFRFGSNWNGGSFGYGNYGYSRPSYGFGLPRFGGYGR
jgi:hypothetical protein